MGIYGFYREEGEEQKYLEAKAQRLKAPPVPRKEGNLEGYLMASAR